MTPRAIEDQLNKDTQASRVQPGSPWTPHDQPPGIPGPEYPYRRPDGQTPWERTGASQHAKVKIHVRHQGTDLNTKLIKSQRTKTTLRVGSLPQGQPAPSTCPSHHLTGERHLLTSTTVQKQCYSASLPASQWRYLGLCTSIFLNFQ